MSIHNFVESKNLELYAKEVKCIIPFNEDDFEKAYNQIFTEDKLIEENEDQNAEIITKCYYYNHNIFTKNEEPAQIYQIYNDLEFIKDKKSKEGSINEKKDDYVEENGQINIKIEIKEDKEDEMKELIHEEPNEPNNISNEGKKNIFRTYNSQEYILFHPGGMVKYFKDIKDEIIKEFLNPKKKKGKSAQNNLTFNIYINNRKQKQGKPNGKKRKDKPDNIRKKIKARFLKILRTRINDKLKNSNSTLFFDKLPQCFISNISKNGNKYILDMTIKELLTKNFFEDDTSKENSNKTFIQKKRNPDKDKNKKNQKVLKSLDGNSDKRKPNKDQFKKIQKVLECDTNNDTRNPNKDKYEKNQKVLEYLDNNSEIRNNSNFNVISKLTFREIFKEYLKSEEFENDILELKNKNNNEKYIKDYIIKAYDFLDYFSKEN
jgi:hypothetical protein